MLIEFPINIKKFNSYKERQTQLKKNLQEDENNPKCIMCYDECLKYFNYCYRRNKNPEEYLWKSVF